MSHCSYFTYQVLIVLILLIKFFSSVKTYFVSPFPLIADLRVVLGTRKS